MGRLMGVSIKKRGPLFDRRREQIIEQFSKDLEKETADELVKLIKSELNRVLKTQTPYYRTKIKRERNKATDSGVVYGPWLEGTGSRNYPVTRFRGYHTFSRMQRVVEAELPRITKRVEKRWIRKLG